MTNGFYLFLKNSNKMGPTRFCFYGAKSCGSFYIIIGGTTKQKRGRAADREKEIPLQTGCSGFWFKIQRLQLCALLI